MGEGTSTVWTRDSNGHEIVLPAPRAADQFWAKAREQGFRTDWPGWKDWSTHQQHVFGRLKGHDGSTVLWGDPGTGKTMLGLHAALLRYTGAMIPVTTDGTKPGVGQVSTPTGARWPRAEVIRYQDFRDSFMPGQRHDRETATSVVNRYVDCDFLMIDDVGHGNENHDNIQDFESSNLFNVLDKRLSARRPTVLTMNLTLTRFGQIYGGSLLSRLRDHYNSQEWGFGPLATEGRESDPDYRVEVKGE